MTAEHPPPANVVLDVDTGVDDALALLFAARHPALRLLGVTCVGGNADVDQVVRNTLTVLAAARRSDVPVARGSDRPLLEPARRAGHVHGADGLGDLGWPAAEHQADPRHAVEFLRDVLGTAAAANDPEALVTLVALAPQTNLALLLRTWPECAAGLREIVFMGGSAASGNATASAEFNVWHDPEATAIVLQTAAERQVPVTMYGLDVFYGVGVTAEQAAGLDDSDGTAPALARRLLAFQHARMGAPATIGDAGAVCALVDPVGITTQRCPVRVELAGRWTRGRTVVDRRTGALDLANDPHGSADAVVDVALAVDGARYAELWLSTVGAAHTRP